MLYEDLFKEGTSGEEDNKQDEPNESNIPSEQEEDDEPSSNNPNNLEDDLEAILERKIEIIEAEYQRLYETKITEFVEAEGMKYQKLESEYSEVQERFCLIQSELEYYKKIALDHLEEKQAIRREVEDEIRRTGGSNNKKTNHTEELIPMTDQIKTRMKMEKYKTEVHTNLKDHYEKEKAKLKKELDEEKAEVGRLKSQMNIKLKKLNEYKRKMDVEMDETKAGHETDINEMKSDIEHIIRINSELTSQNAYLKGELKEAKLKIDILSSEAIKLSQSCKQPDVNTMSVNEKVLRPVAVQETKMPKVKNRPVRGTFIFTIMTENRNIESVIPKNVKQVEYEAGKDQREVIISSKLQKKPPKIENKQEVAKVVTKTAKKQDYSYNDVMNNQKLFNQALKQDKKTKTVGGKRTMENTGEGAKVLLDGQKKLKDIYNMLREVDRIDKTMPISQKEQLSLYRMYTNNDPEDENADIRMKGFIRFINSEYLADCGLSRKIAELESLILGSHIDDYLLLENTTIKSLTKTAILAKYEDLKARWSIMHVSNRQRLNLLIKLKETDTLNEIQQLLDDHCKTLSSSMSRYEEIYQMLKLRTELKERIYRLADECPNEEKFIATSFKHLKQLTTLLKDVKRWRQLDEPIGSIRYFILDIDSMIEADDWEIGYMDKQKIRVSIKQRIKGLK